MAEQTFNERTMREEICEIGRRIWHREYVAANDGNISVRLNANEILATPTGVSKGFLTPDMLVVIDRAGNKLRGTMKPSSELKMHRAFYDARPDVRAVCHAHPLTATGFAVAGLSLDRCTLPEVVITLGSVPLAKYGVPGSDELTQDILDNYVQEYDAFLLANHGVVTIGQTVMNAYYKMETVEHFAKISLVARQLGSENVFSPERAQELMEARARYGVQAGGSCRIEYKDKDKNVNYAPDVPRTGFGAAAYAGASDDNANARPSAQSNNAANGSNGKPAEIEIGEEELRRIIGEVARRVAESLQK
ncbi:MAG: class II aldolase/adducin family protein [Abitibacteriaceae bacterium]|nr:class II aldolase/adducin family protein [Abditibacteriaceae bacterium]